MFLYIFTIVLEVYIDYTAFFPAIDYVEHGRNNPSTRVYAAIDSYQSFFDSSPVMLID